ncbi:MAG TPA: ImmA/IrrE family metallo-endopeptidase [Bryobacteraceae bacterium]|nr:ImmA/IrrE family metallo-endopeptidase [Bryobacteraceae bacterium]
MERIRVAGKVYTDPDILSLIGSRSELVDPQREVIRRARELNQKLRDLGDVHDGPRQRIEVLASLAGIKVAPMQGSGVGSGVRDALIYREFDGSRRIYYNPTLLEGRINFSIGHEIIHTFFPNSVSGARFRSMCADDSKEGNELERLCDRGAAELLMPVEEFREEVGDEISLLAIPRLCERFGSSYEATVYRLATTYERIAIAGLLKYRHRKNEVKKIASSQRPLLFAAVNEGTAPRAKLRRQSLHTSDSCGPQHVIQWNKSFSEDSCVYRAATQAGMQSDFERLPNSCEEEGIIEAVRAPFQTPKGRSGIARRAVLLVQIGRNASDSTQ